MSGRKKSSVLSRRQSVVWLIGSVAEKLTGSRLPSNREVLSVFFYNHKTLKKTIRQSSTAVVRETLVFWNKARIPTRHEKNIITKLEDLHKKWINLKKNASRKSYKQQDRQREFVEDLDNLFDIAHVDAEKLITIPEDKEFLAAQREKGRRGCLGPVDRILAAQERRRGERKKIHEERKKREEQQKKAREEVVTGEILSNSDKDESSDAEPCSSQDCEILKIPASVRKRARINVITPAVAASLDRTKLSDRKAAFVLSATALCLGHDVADLNINRSSIHRRRKRIRSDLAANLKAQLQSTTALLEVSWDGKLIKDLSGRDIEDRLPVIVSGSGISQLLGVPKIASSRGEAQATAVADLITEWGLVDCIVAMCFDTTASNTGHTSGACVLLEQKLEKRLLHLACRHHILELILAGVFKESLELMSGPDVAIFKRFQQAWSSLDHNKYKVGCDNEVAMSALDRDRQDIREFVLSQLTLNHPRDDYFEFLNLVLIFLGDVPPNGVRFRTPGALHHARWMAKALYALKMWMFRGQFKLTNREAKGLLDVCIFTVLVYVRAWFSAPLSASAPNNDLLLLKSIVDYHRINPMLSDVAYKKFSAHLWYLSEELIGLSFFDPCVSAESKRAMAVNIREKVGVCDPPKRANLNAEDVGNMQIQDFVTQNTMKFFQCLDISTAFLDQDPETWDSRTDYVANKDVVQHLRVVNDHAERGVALIEEYNCILTKNEEQKQFLLQVVQDHRKQFANSSKGCLMK